MAVDFPSSPSVNDTHTANGRTWIWNGTAWAVRGGLAGGTTSAPAGSDGQVQYNNGGTTGGASSLYYDDANDRVGIGTTIPSYELDLTGTINASSRVRIGGESGLFLSGSTIQVGSASSGKSLSLNAGAADRVFIDSSGNVGIGTASPGAPLEVADATNALVYVNDTGGTKGSSLNSKIWFQGSGVNSGVVGFNNTGSGIMALSNQDGPVYLETKTNDSLQLRTNDSTRVTVTGAGDVDVVNGLNAGGVVTVSSSSGLRIDPNDATYIKIGNSNSSTDILQVDSIGGIDFVIDRNNNSTGKQFRWKTNGDEGAGDTLMLLNDGGNMIHYGELQVRPSGANASMLYLYPTGLTAGARGMTVRGPTDSSSAPVKFETGNSFAFVTDGTTRLTIDNNGISKSGGTFDIQHPLDAEDSASRLRHGFVESPYNDNLYRGTSTLDGNGEAVIDLDSHYGMRDGTWMALNTNPWVIASVNGGSSVSWDLVGKTLTLTGTSGESVQWLVIGERHDPHVMSEETTSTDENGRLILEYIREWADDPDWTPPDFTEEAG